MWKLGLGNTLGDTLGDTMATLLQLRTRVAKLLADTGFSVVSSADIDQYINDAEESLTESIRILTKIGTISSVSGTQTYGLAANHHCMFGEHKTVIYTDASGALHYPVQISFTELLDNFQPTITSARGTPIYYYLTETTMGFYPTPNYSGTSNISYYYCGYPTALAADSDSSELGRRWVRTVVYKATSLALESLERHSEAQMFHRMYEDEFARVSNLGDYIPTSRNTHSIKYFGDVS